MIATLFASVLVDFYAPCFTFKSQEKYLFYLLWNNLNIVRNAASLHTLNSFSLRDLVDKYVTLAGWMRYYLYVHLNNEGMSHTCRIRRDRLVAAVSLFKVRYTVVWFQTQQSINTSHSSGWCPWTGGTYLS